MNRFAHLFSILTLLFLFCCMSCNKYVNKGVVEFNGNAQFQSGVISVVSWVTTKDLETAKKFARENALEKVLFEGIPGSSVKRPIFNGDPDAPKNRRYFKKLLSSPERFVKVHSYKAADRIKTKVGYKMGINCSIYYKNLIKKLERDGIIKEFGL